MSFVSTGKNIHEIMFNTSKSWTGHLIKNYIDMRTKCTFMVQEDPDAEDPRHWWSNSECSLIVYNAPRNYRVNDPDDYSNNPAVEAFWNLFEEHDADEITNDMINEWINEHYPDAPHYKTYMETGNGYSQSDWWEIFVAVTENCGDPGSYADEFNQFMRGDVWIVEPDEIDGYEGEPLGGIYAGSEEEAVEYYVENHLSKKKDPWEIEGEPRVVEVSPEKVTITPAIYKDEVTGITCYVSKSDDRRYFVELLDNPLFPMPTDRSRAIVIASSPLMAMVNYIDGIAKRKDTDGTENNHPQ